jgi:enoyl-CoA hydratase/carnithine racemase
MSTGLLVDSPRPGVRRLLLNRPQRRNALDANLAGALLDALDDRARTSVRVVVLGSSTRGIFSAGADLGLDDATRARLSETLYAVYEAMVDHPAILIVAVDGAAIGGGAQLAIASDLRVFSTDAWLRIVGPGHGLAIGSWGLPSLVGRGHAMRLCVTGDKVAADEAARIGLADRVCAADPIDVAMTLAGDLAELDPGALQRVKRIVVSGAGLKDALRAEADGNRHWAGSVPRR